MTGYNSEKELDIQGKGEINEFISMLKKIGGRATNPNLMKKLGWDKDKYWKIHGKAYDKSLIEKARGKGGVVILVEQDNGEEAKNKKSNEDLKSEPDGEVRYYKEVYKSLSDMWIPQQDYDSHILEITAHLGRKSTGKWSRPDLLLVTKKSIPIYSKI